MRALLDMPVSMALIPVLEEFGHSGVHAYHLGKERALDRELLEIAGNENRVVITADLDFPRLLALSSARGPGLILFRSGNYSEMEMCALLRKVLETVEPETLERSVCVVDKKRVRIRPLPLRAL